MFIILQTLRIGSAAKGQEKDEIGTRMERYIRRLHSWECVQTNQSMGED